MADRPPARGSVLLLFPAALLVVLVLCSLAIDAAAVFVRQRELLDAAAAAANDAATAGLDVDHLRATGEIRLDPGRVDATVAASLAARGALDELTARPEWRIVDDRRVEVTLAARAAYVLSPVLPGAPDGRDLEVTAVGTAVVLGSDP